jgi:hypothetical protein
VRVKCLSEYPSKEEIKQLGKGFCRKQSFGVEIGREYTVLALDFFVRSNLFGTGPYVEIADELDRLGWAPLCLFEILDASVSRFWKACVLEHSTLSLAPPAFRTEYYHDDLSERVPEVVEDFRRLRALLEAEAIGYQTGSDSER